MKLSIDSSINGALTLLDFRIDAAVHRPPPRREVSIYCQQCAIFSSLKTVVVLPPLSCLIRGSSGNYSKTQS
jgi:hypothetical protein